MEKLAAREIPITGKLRDTLNSMFYQNSEQGRFSVELIRKTPDGRIFRIMEHPYNDTNYTLQEEKDGDDIFLHVCNFRDETVGMLRIARKDAHFTFFDEYVNKFFRNHKIEEEV